MLTLRSCRDVPFDEYVLGVSAEDPSGPVHVGLVAPNRDRLAGSLIGTDNANAGSWHSDDLEPFDHDIGGILQIDAVGGPCVRCIDSHVPNGCES